MRAIACFFALLVSLAAAGCGGTSAVGGDSTRSRAAGWPAALCAREAGWASDHARRILRYYGPGQVYPADVALLSFTLSVTRFEQHGCGPAVLGRALKRQLTAKQRAELLTHLPATLARTVRRAIAAAS